LRFSTDVERQLFGQHLFVEKRKPKRGRQNRHHREKVIVVLSFCYEPKYKSNQANGKKNSESL